MAEKIRQYVAIDAKSFYASVECVERHTGHGEILVQHIEGRGIAAPAAGDHRRAHLHGFVHAQGAEKQPVHEGDSAARRGGKVHRRADDECICRGQFGRNFVHNIIKDTFARFVALSSAWLSVSNAPEIT